MKVTLVDKDGRSVATSSEQSGVLKVADVKLWWPYLMHENPAYLYSLEVRRQAGTSRKKARKENILNGSVFMQEELVAGVKHLTKDNKTCINIPQILALGSACARK